MRFAAIDFGGSFVKSALVDPATGTLHHRHRTPFPPFAPGLPPSWREVELSRIVADATEHLERLLEAEPACAGILVSTQMHGFALVGAAGRPASNFVSWQDQRGLDIGAGTGPSFQAFSAAFSPEALAAAGRDIGPGHAAAVLHAMRTEGSHGREGSVPVPLPNAVFAAAFGVKPAADETLAASFGVFDLERRRWNSDLIAALGLDVFEWPAVTRWNDVIGEIPHRGRRIPLYSPVGDQQAALAGALLDEGELSVNVGTGSQVSSLSSAFTSGPAKVRPYFDGGFLRTVTHIPAGRALNALVGLIAGREPGGTSRVWELIDDSLSATASTDLRVDLSFFPSAFGQRGRIENIHEGNLTPGHLFLAAFENMADNYLAAATSLHPERDWGPIAFSGGLAHRFGRLREIVALRLARPSRLSPGEEETLTGLGSLARVLAGFEPTVREACRSIRRQLPAMQ